MKLLLQGLTEETHLAELSTLFAVPDLQSVICSVAFVNEAGVAEIEEALNPVAASTTVIAGIRNDITSFQGLRRLRSIIGNKLYVFDTGTRHIIFHPKLYLAIGDLEARLIVGSANLTLGGLNNNVEASVVADFDLSNGDDLAAVDGIVNILTGLSAEYPSHVTRITSEKQIEGLLSSGRIIDENQMKPVTPSRLAPNVNSDTIPPIKLKVPTRRPKLTRIRLAAPAQPRAVPAALPASMANISALYELVWESKPLRWPFVEASNTP